METVVITGGTGLVGNALTKALLEKGYAVIILSRNPSKERTKKPQLSYAEWDVKQGQIETRAIAKADHIIHLAGANVADKRWTDERKKEILESRTKSAALLVSSLKHIENNCKTVISASAIGWYGPDPEIPNKHPFTENAPANTDFLGETCKAWEESIHPVMDLDKRLVILRTGIVLSKEGGAYKAFRRTIPLGIAPVLGDGKQVISWIHMTDLVRLYIEAIENPKWDGIYNAVAPNPVNNETLINTIAKEKRKFYFKPKVPAGLLKIALGEMSIEVLKSCTVSSKKVENTGFSYFFPTIESAVKNLR